MTTAPLPGRAPAPGARATTAASRPADRAATRAVRLLDGLFLLTLLTVTFEKVRWTFAGTVTFSDISALLFLLAYGASMVGRPRRPQPRTVAIVLLFFLLLLAVFLCGYFDLEAGDASKQFQKGIVKWAIHFLFLAAAVSLLARRGPRFYWRAFGWFMGGIVLNCAYAIVQLVAAQGGMNLDNLVLNRITGGASAINLYGAVNGSSVFRPNALTGDPNHLGIMLVIPLLVLTPLWLRMERANPWFRRLPWLIGFMVIIEIATLSRSGILGLLVGLVLLLVPYRRKFRSGQLLKPLGGVVLVLAVVIAARAHYFWVVLRTRVGAGSSDTSASVHFSIYSFVPKILHSEPLFGLGLNTFSVFYEEATGKTNWGPHSYFVALIVETGLVGTVVYGAFIIWVFARLGAARRLGAAYAAAGNPLAARVRPLAWGMTAALIATLVSNIFYLTMQFYYFYAFIALALAAPVVFGPRRGGGRSADGTGPGVAAPARKA
jgi:O-antigen ligase